MPRQALQLKTLLPKRAVMASICAAMFLGGCASMDNAPRAGAIPSPIPDPFEGFNRGAHAFNKGLDQAVIRPAAQLYDTVTPELAQHLVRNGLDFLDMPRVIINSALQGDFERTRLSATRMAVNGLLGLGVLDPATDFGIPKFDEDFGQTMAVWGVGEGVYHETPLFGPNTTRSGAGLIVDSFLNPFGYLGGVVGLDDAASTAFTASRVGAGIVTLRDDNFDLIDNVLYESEDSYSRLRGAFVQRRRTEARNGEVDVEALPDIYEDGGRF